MQAGYYVALSIGSGFGAVRQWTNVFDLSHGWTVAQFVRTVGDVNGNGKADLVGFGLDGVYVALSTGTGFGAVSQWTSDQIMYFIKIEGSISSGYQKSFN